jgi:hypothetical protein
MIVSRTGNYTRIAICAQNIADNANVAFWTRDVQNAVTKMKEDDIIEDFKAMAKLLGYRIERIEG